MTFFKDYYQNIFDLLNTIDEKEILNVVRIKKMLILKMVS